MAASSSIPVSAALPRGVSGKAAPAATALLRSARRQPHSPICQRSRTAASGEQTSGGPGQGIKDFIAAECPLPGFDGRLREQPRDAAIECTCLPVAIEAVTVPGARHVFRMPLPQLDAVIEDKGQVVVAAIDGPPGARTPLAPPRSGSYAVAGQVVGVQRLQNEGMARCVITERVAVQALAEPDSAPARVQAAVLRDRWAFFVRADAVEAALAAAAAGQDASLAGDQAVAGAVASCLDAAQELQTEVAALAQLLEGHTEGAEPADELRAVLAAALALPDQLHVPNDAVPDAAAATAIPCSGGQLWRLSFVPFAVPAVAAACGAGRERHGEVVRAALQATDVGMRLEDACAYCRELRGMWTARSSLRAL